MGRFSIQKESIAATNNNLAANCYLVMRLESNGGSGLVGIVKDNRDAGLRDTSLSLFVYKFRQISSPNFREIRYAENEADAIKDVRFPWAIQTCNCIKLGVEGAEYSANGVPRLR